MYKRQVLFTTAGMQPLVPYLLGEKHPNGTRPVSYTHLHDIDVLSVVNELINAGAEAISINDQRWVANTAISCRGNTIDINGERIGAPFVIKAIGLPEYLS